MSGYPEHLKANFPQIKIPARMDEHMASKMARIKDPAIRAGEMTVAAMENLMSGEATFTALQVAVNQTALAAPADHDIVILAFGIVVTNVSFAQPHTLILGGRKADGHTTIVVAHFSQMVAQVVYQPKQGPERIITGFGVEPEAPAV